MRRFRKDEIHDQEDNECAEIPHGETIPGDSPVRMSGRDAREERVIENDAPLESDIGDNKEHDPEQDHSLLDEEHQACADNARQGKEKEKRLLVAGIVRCRAQRRGDGSRKDHREADSEAPQPSLSTSDMVGKVPGVDYGDNDYRKRRVGEVKERPRENLSVGI